MDAARERILDHYKNPRNLGRMKDATHSGTSINESCGDSIEIFLRVDDNDTITDASFIGNGCALSLASASLLTVWLKGKVVNEVIQSGEKLLQEILRMDLKTNRLKCAKMGLEAAQEALGDND